MSRTNQTGRYRQSTHLALVVLESMRLVHDEHVPVDAAEQRRVDADELVGGEQHVELDIAALAQLGCLGALADGSL